MRRNWVSLLCVFAIIAISWIDSQYFNDVVGMADTKRKVFHILFLALVMGIGYIPFAVNNIKWTRQLWIFSYTLVFAIILATGALNKVFHFSTGFMDEIFLLRIWFCSPLPFMAIFVLSKLKGMVNTENKQAPTNSDIDA